MIGDLADHRARKLPALAGGAHVVEQPRLDDGDHPLLRLGDHDLPRLEIGLAERHAVEMNVDAGTRGGHLGERRGEPGRAAVLQADDEVALDEIERDLDQRLAAERVADLDGGPLLVGALEILAREHRGAADPVAAGECAVEDDQVSRPGRLGAQHALGRQQPDAHRVDERVRGVGLVEHRLAADGRNADGVPVLADPRDRAAEVPVGRAEPEPVEERDRPGAHRDDVAEDPADPGRGALERLDRGRVVVRLDLEGDGEAVAHVDHAGVLAGALQHALALGGQPPQERSGMLVAAVLGPEHREDRELEVVRRPLEQLLDPRELPVGETERAVERLLGDDAQGASLAADPRTHPQEGFAVPGRFVSRGGASGRYNLSMSRRDTTMIIALSLIWGASFMFIRVADRQFDPAALVWFRVLLGCVVLVPVALIATGRAGLKQARSAWVAILLVGLINTATPFMLFAWAETRIDSSLTAILQAAVPIFTVVIAVRFANERVSGIRWAGILIGFAGVALLVGSPGKGGALASLAVVPPPSATRSGRRSAHGCSGEPSPSSSQRARPSPRRSSSPRSGRRGFRPRFRAGRNAGR